MRAIRARNTRPELRLRRALHAAGLRYRLHDKKLPGSPDLVFPRYQAVLFVHGCFWHRHGCSRSTLPATRADFWSEKLEANRQRDLKVRAALLAMGWRVGVVWECALKAKVEGGVSDTALAVANWLTGSNTDFELPPNC